MVSILHHCLIFGVHFCGHTILPEIKNPMMQKLFNGYGDLTALDVAGQTATIRNYR